jgi:hypothetical protein
MHSSSFFTPARRGREDPRRGNEHAVERGGAVEEAGQGVQGLVTATRRLVVVALLALLAGCDGPKVNLVTCNPECTKP